MNNFLQDSKVVHPTLAKMDLHAKLTSEEKLIASKYLGKPSKKINSGYNEFGTISLYTLPPLINSEKSNSENLSQSGYPPSLRK